MSQCFNPHCFNVSIFQYALPCGSDSETFTKSGIKKSCKFCQIAKCSVFIITDLWKITILLSLIYKIPEGKLSEKPNFFRSKTVGFPKSLWRHKISDHSNTSFHLFLIIWGIFPDPAIKNGTLFRFLRYSKTHKLFLQKSKKFIQRAIIQPSTEQITSPYGKMIIIRKVICSVRFPQYYYI